jgi:hypothetical protein
LFQANPACRQAAKYPEAQDALRLLHFFFAFLHEINIFN